MNIMELIQFDKKDRKAKNVIYQITCFMGSHNKQYHYIGMTKRELDKRFNEHITNEKSAVYKFITEHAKDFKYIKVEVLKEVKYIPHLDKEETKAIGKYILQKGTKANKKNHLLNRDLKGLEKLTLKQIADCIANM